MFANGRKNPSGRLSHEHSSESLTLWEEFAYDSTAMIVSSFSHRWCEGPAGWFQFGSPFSIRSHSHQKGAKIEKAWTRHIPRIVWFQTRHCIDSKVDCRPHELGRAGAQTASAVQGQLEGSSFKECSRLQEDDGGAGTGCIRGGLLYSCPGRLRGPEFPVRTCRGGTSESEPLSARRGFEFLGGGEMVCTGP